MTHKQVITIHWQRQHSKHEVELDDNYYSGYCLTHKQFVSRNTRCPNFPCQTAMWADLWNVAIQKLE